MYRTVISTLLVCLLLAGCGPKGNKIVSHPLGYDLLNPKVLTLPVALKEISGLSYYPKDSSLFAIVDEQAYLYKIFPYRNGVMFRWKYGGHGDYEDICKLDSAFYILQSDGAIFSVVIRGKDDVVTTSYHFEEKGNEFESLYWDDSTKRLVMVCKDCENDKRKSVSTYAFDPVARAYSPGSLAIDAKDVAGMIGQDKIKLKPSAAAIQPITGKLFILSSVNKLLIVGNRDGTIDGAFPLDEKLYKQPEGIAFAPDGTLFISNEQAGKGSATLFTIPYQLNSTLK